MDYYSNINEKMRYGNKNFVNYGCIVHNKRKNLQLKDDMGNFLKLCLRKI